MGKSPFRDEKVTIFPLFRPEIMLEGSRDPPPLSELLKRRKNVVGPQIIDVKRFSPQGVKSRMEESSAT